MKNAGIFLAVIVLVSAITAWGQAMTPPPSPEGAWNRVAEYGVVAGIAVFLIYTGWAREKMTANHVESLNAFVRESLLDALNNSTEAITDMAEQFKRRPCIGGKKGEDADDAK
jgi:hypothetical protein